MELRGRRTNLITFEEAGNYYPEIDQQLLREMLEYQPQQPEITLWTGTVGVREFDRAMRQAAVTWDVNQFHYYSTSAGPIPPAGWTQIITDSNGVVTSASIKVEPEVVPEHIKNPFFFIAKNRAKK